MKKLLYYCKKVKRARNIKRIRDKIAPYLQKDFGVELNYKLWTTKGARFSASERNSILNDLSAKTIGYLSAYLIIVNLINLYHVPYLKQMPDNELGFVSTALSILILVYSQFEFAKNYAIKSEKFHQCSLEIGELYNELRMVKTSRIEDNQEDRVRTISEKYDIILRKYENHSPIDFEYFTTTKKYFGLNKLEILSVKIRKYLQIQFKYHLFMYGPIILFIYYQVKNN